MDDIINGLLNDARAERNSELWERYGKWIIYVAISIILVTAGIVYWQHHTRETAMQQTNLYFQASSLLTKGEAGAALNINQTMNVPERSPYYGLMLLQRAQAQQAIGDKEKTTHTLTLLAERDSVYGDVGKILQGSAYEPSADSPLHYSRREWAAWNQLSAGNEQKAAQEFAALAKEKNAPVTLRERASMMQQYLQYEVDR